MVDSIEDKPIIRVERDPIKDKPIIRVEREASAKREDKPDIFSLENIKQGLPGQIGTLVGEFLASKATGKTDDFQKHFDQVKDKISDLSFLPSMQEVVSGLKGTVKEIVNHPIEAVKDIARDIVRNPQDLLLGTSGISKGISQVAGKTTGSIAGGAAELGLLEGGRQAFENINKSDPDITKITKSMFQAAGTGAVTGGVLNLFPKRGSPPPALLTEEKTLKPIVTLPVAAGIVLAVDEATGQKDVIPSIAAGLVLTGLLRKAPALYDAIKIKPVDTLKRGAVVGGYLAAGAYIDKTSVWEGLMVGGLLASIPYWRKGTPEIYSKLGADPDTMGRVMSSMIARDEFIANERSKPLKGKHVLTDASANENLTALFNRLMKHPDAATLYRNTIYGVSRLLNKEIEGEVRRPEIGRRIILKSKKEEPNQEAPNAKEGQAAKQIIKPVSETFPQFLSKLKGYGLDVETDASVLYRALYNAETSTALHKGFLNFLKSSGGATKDAIVKGQRDFFIADKKMLKTHPEIFKDYIHIENPLFAGYVVHKQLAPSVRFLFESSRLNDPVRGLISTAMLAKRLNFMGSYFHLINLTISSMMLTGIWDKGKFINPFNMVKSGLDILKNSPLGPEMDLVLRHGVRLEHAPDLDTEILKKLGDSGDALLHRIDINTQGGLGKALGAAERLQVKYFDALTWDYGHKGFKIGTFLHLYAKKLAEHPKVPAEEIGRQVADVVNTAFGGLNWFDIATQTDTYLTRKTAMLTLNPHSRKIMQMFLQAPDWTIATSLSVFRGLPYTKASGPIAKQIYQQTLLRNLLFHFTLLNGLNYALSGHFIWQNEDPTKIDLPDGSKMTVNRHGTEFWELMENPSKILAGKTSTLAKQTFEQTFRQEWIGGPKFQHDAIQHLLHGLLPIPSSTFFKEATKGHYGEAMFKTLLSIGGVTFSGKRFKAGETFETRKMRQNRKNRR